MVIKVENLTKKYGGKTVLQGMNLEIPQGQCVSLLGPNGAGKSTLLKLLAGLIKPTDGTISLGGCQVNQNPLGFRKKVGMVSHHSLLYDRLTPWENLWFYGKLYDVQDLKKRIGQVLERVGLQYFTYDPVYTFSRGMVQRLTIARAVLHDPEIIFLDEPYTGLDHHAEKILNDMLAVFKEKKRTVVLVTHNFAQGVEWSDRALILVKGKFVYDAPVREFDYQDFKNTYLAYVGEEH